MPAKMKSVFGERAPIVRLAAARAGAEQPAGAEPEQRLHELVARVRRVGERVEPDVDPAPGRAPNEPVARCSGAAEEEQQADDQPAEPARWRCTASPRTCRSTSARCRGPSRRPGPQAQHPDHEHRAQVAARGEVDAEEPAAGQRQHFALAHQVVGEEDSSASLANSPGWMEKPAEQDPQLGAVDLRVVAGQQRRDQHQHDAGRGRACRRTGTARGGRGRPAARRRTAPTPTRSTASCRSPSRDGAVPSCAARAAAARSSRRMRTTPEPVEQRDRRQQHRVGVRRQQADRDVRAEEDREQHPAP